MTDIRQLVRTAGRKFLDDPRGLFSNLGDRSTRHELGQRLNTIYHSRNRRRTENPEGVDVFAEDWDNLILLDACRYDEFADAKRRHDFPGTLERRVSRGSQTPEWLKANFHDRELHDVVYVSGTAMPAHLSLMDSDHLTERQRRWGFDIDVHDLINVWADPDDDWYEMYIDRIQSYIVPPEVMCEAALDARDQYPNKRLLVHITPPHDPYLGPSGRELHEESDRPWHDYLEGELEADVDTLRQAYRENVDLAISAVSELIEGLDGRTVVTSDHGDLLWERSWPVPIREFLHPEQTYVEELVTVPWNVVEGDRLEITADPPADYRDRVRDESVSTDQLRALGYV